jgi:hypothetical protein
MIKNSFYLETFLFFLGGRSAEVYRPSGPTIVSQPASTAGGYYRDVHRV